MHKFPKIAIPNWHKRNKNTFTKQFSFFFSFLLVWFFLHAYLQEVKEFCYSGTNANGLLKEYEIICAFW